MVCKGVVRLRGMMKLGKEKKKVLGNGQGAGNFRQVSQGRKGDISGRRLSEGSAMFMWSR